MSPWPSLGGKVRESKMQKRSQKATEKRAVNFLGLHLSAMGRVFGGFTDLSGAFILRFRLAYVSGVTEHHCVGSLESFLSKDERYLP
jgi:hypothetical protein